jgi:hypothetical protein
VILRRDRCTSVDSCAAAACVSGVWTCIHSQVDVRVFLVVVSSIRSVWLMIPQTAVMYASMSIPHGLAPSQMSRINQR